MVVLCGSDSRAPPLHRTNFRNSSSLLLMGAAARFWRGGGLAADSLRGRGNGIAPAVTDKLNRSLQEPPATIAAMPQVRKLSYSQAAGTPLPSRMTHHGCPGARALMASASNAWAARASIPATTTAPSSSKKYNPANLVGYTALLRKVGYAARPSSMPSVRKLKTRFQNETRQRGATAPTEFTACGLQSASNFNQLSSGVARPQRIRRF